MEDFEALRRLMTIGLQVADDTYIGRLSFSESSFWTRFHARGPKCQLQSFLPPWSSFARFNE